MENLKNFVGEITIDYKRTTIPNVKINSPQTSYETLRPLYTAINYKEKSWALFLNQSLDLCGYAQISDGASNATLMDIKIIVQHALMSHSSHIIISHNHPSGNLKPSTADKSVTKRLKEACDLFDIKLADHLILTDQEYFSFANEGLL